MKSPEKKLLEETIRRIVREELALTSIDPPCSSAPDCPACGSDATHWMGRGASENSRRAICRKCRKTKTYYLGEEK